MGGCQFTDRIHNTLFLRAVSEHHFMIDRLGVSGRKQASLIRRELSAVFLIPLFFPIVLTILLIARTQLLFGETIFRCKGTCPLKEPALYLIHTYVAVFQLPLD